MPELDEVLSEVSSSGKSRWVALCARVRAMSASPLLAGCQAQGRTALRHHAHACPARRDCRFDWESLKAVIGAKVEQVCAEYYSSNKDLNEPYEELLKRLLSLLQEFPHAPFTVQRLCELILDPHRIYVTSTRKVTSAIEKLLTVSSTVPVMQVAVPRPGTYQAAAETELKTLVGGDGGEPMEIEQ